MKIKDMANEIREQMPEGLNELETLRYIYIYLGKKKNFDCCYMLGDRETSAKIYRLAEQRLNDENFLTETKDLICTSISSALRMLAKEFDINIELEREEFKTDEHMYNIAYLKDGRMIKLDLQQDLRFIHTNKITRHFGPVDKKYITCDCIPIEELEKIDEKIGYKTDNYKRNDIEMFMQKTQGMGLLESVKCILNSNEFNEVLKQSDGYSELLSYVKSVLGECTDQVNVRVINCYRDKNINKENLPKRQYSMCVYAMKADKCDIYMFKNKEKKFIPVTAKEMNRLMNQGLCLGGERYFAKKLVQSIKQEDNSLEER